MSQTISAEQSYPTNTTPSDDSLVLDTDAMDFFTLDDHNFAVSDKSTAVDPNDKEVSDQGFDDNNLDEDFEEIEDEANDEVDEASEEADEADSGEEEVDYDGYEVTLPNGEVIKLDEAVKGYKAAKALEEEKQSFEEARAEFEEGSKEVGKFLDLAKLETLKVIEDYADFDWAGLARTDPQAYVDNKEFYETYVARYNDIMQAQKTLDAKREAEQQTAMEAQARSCVSVLQRDIPNWGPELYQDLMAYGVENGASPEEMQACVDPAIFKMMHKAMQFDKGVQTVKAKIKAVVKQPAKVAKSQSKGEAPTKKSNMERKLSSGDFNDRDVDAMFSMLED